ncbi:MAG: hypothetical protein KDB21_07165 [Acidimicrobiales bacterium]|nr:hypothetical protein [Acidimicrobiales bacterium]
MTEQLPFLPEPTTSLAPVPNPPASAERLWWRLDDDTKRVGREGVARARQALQEARQRALHPADHIEHPTAA